MSKAAGAVVVRPLREAPGALGPLADLLRLTWPGWYGPDGPGDALADLRARLRRAGLPLGLVALRDGAPVGTVALDATSHGARAGEAPWLVGLVVASDARGRGVGSALVAAAEARARADGAQALHATTGPALGLLRRRGWVALRVLADGETVLRTGAPPAGPPGPQGAGT